MFACLEARKCICVRACPCLRMLRRALLCACLRARSVRADLCERACRRCLSFVPAGGMDVINQMVRDQVRDGSGLVLISSQRFWKLIPIASACVCWARL